MATHHRLIAVMQDGRKILHPTHFTDWNRAINMWQRHDDARIEGNRPHVSHYAIREAGHEYTVGASTMLSPFRNREPSAEILTDSEYAEIIGALQIVRDRAEAEGRDPVHVRSALAKVTRGCTPSTIGMEFRLIEGA